MSKQQTIGVDIDDVLAAHLPAFVKYSNDTYNTGLTAETYEEYWPNLWNISMDETLKRAREFHELTVASYERIADADSVLANLSKKYRLVIVTARPKYNIEATHEWIGQHFKDVFDDIHFVPIWEPDNKVTKADICKQIGADYLIDDIPRHCNFAAEAGVAALLFGGYTWSRDHLVHDDVVRVNNWHEVGEHFNV
ncbi:MAG: 5' nucleotidase, NT5C type [Candidatus Saccharimonadales bacterium]